MKILVTGGAGYIGSFMTRRLLEEGQEVTVVCFFAVGFEERCCEGVCVSFYRMVIA